MTILQEAETEVAIGNSGTLTGEKNGYWNDYNKK